MPFAILHIPGVSGGISTEFSFWRGFKFHVAGERVTPHGFPRNRLTLPGPSGPVQAKIKSGLARAHPTLVVDGKEYPTGPPTPKGQQILALLPLLLLVLVQGALGIVVAFGAVMVNMGTIRGERSNAIKVGLMVASLVAGAAIDIVLACVVQSALGT